MRETHERIWRTGVEPYRKHLGESPRCGYFLIPKDHYLLGVVSSDGMGWDHVSSSALLDVYMSPQIPSWDDMAFLKSLFFKDDETVVQYHVPASQHINLNNEILHLWRPQNATIILPPRELV